MKKFKRLPKNIVKQLEKKFINGLFQLGENKHFKYVKTLKDF